MELKHASASSINKFVECPASWLVSYDTDTRYNSRTEKTDAGVLVHGALEIFRDPANGIEQTEAELLKCFKQFCGSRSMAESLDVYKRGLKLCKKVWELDQNHPTLPMHLAQTLGVEHKIVDFKLGDWALPMVGSIDRVALVINPKKETECVLVIEDYKTGNAKNFDELVNDDVQPIIYFLYAKHVLQPRIEEQGWTVTKIALVWTFIDAGQAVSMDEEDFQDLDSIVEYIGNIMAQMQSLVAKWNTKGVERTEFLAKYEKQNYHCSWCPRKAECSTFNKLLDLGKTVDLTNPSLSWEEFFKERDRLALAAKEFDERKQAADNIVKIWLQQENKEYIIAGGREWAAAPVNRTTFPVGAVGEILGMDFIYDAAELTKAAIEQELARLKSVDPVAHAKAKEAIEELGRRNTRPGYRKITSRKAKAA